jgi:hypothetical protein
MIPKQSLVCEPEGDPGTSSMIIELKSFYNYCALLLIIMRGEELYTLNMICQLYFNKVINQNFYIREQLRK